MKKVLALATAAVLSGASLSVNAASIFALKDLAPGNGNIGPSASMTVDGITLTVTAGGADMNDQNVGLGVHGGANNLINFGETLTFSFDQDVYLDAIAFGNKWDHVDDGADINVAGTAYNFTAPPSPGNNQINGLNELVLAGQTITVTPDANLGTNQFRVANLQVSNVPLPAAAWLFGSAMLGLLGIGRRRARS